MCGIGYIRGKNTNGIVEAHSAAVLLERLKHRGSDSAGAILSSDTHSTQMSTNLGVDENFLAMARLIRVFRPQDLEDVRGDVRACIHTRYTTDDNAHNPHNGQPMRVGDKGARLKIAFNGNIPNHMDIRRKELAGEVSFQTLGDTETLARFMLHRILQAMQRSSGDVRHSIREAVKEVLDTFKGGYAVVGDFCGETFAFKDKYGIRPLALGKKQNSIVMSSEDASFPEIDHEYYGELQNGHLLFIGPNDALDGEYFPEPENLLTENIIAHPDCFEFIYLANRLSRLFGVSVEAVRKSLGVYAIRELLQTPGNHQYTNVISVPNGANDMKKGILSVLTDIAERPNGLEKIADVRSFMATTQAERERLVEMKFRVNPDGVDTDNNLMVDDSIVRGTTMRVLARKLNTAGANTTQILSASPMVQYGDRYGIAMGTDQLIARDARDSRILSVSEIEQTLFYDINGRRLARLFFPSLEGFRKVFQDHGFSRIHDGYFSGEFCHG